MDYIRLQNLTNQYPQAGNYIPQLTGESILFGLYDTINKVDFKLADFSEVIPVPNITSTRFIIAVTYDESLTKITDSEGDVIEEKLDIETAKINVPKPADTPIDTFANQAKKSKRKKRKGLLGKIGKALLTVTAVATGVAAAAVIPVTAGVLIKNGITRNKKRKQQKLAKFLDNYNIPDDVGTVQEPPLVSKPKKFGERLFGRKKDRRNRLFGKNQNVSNSSTQKPKEPLIGDDNRVKPRIFSDLKIDTDSESIVTKLFCSQLYYDDLISSKTSANPYFINFSFKPEFLIEINTIPILELMDSYLENELENGVLMKRNNFIDDGGINFESLIKYIDWVVTKPDLAEIDTNGVIPANILCEYERGTFDKKTGKWDVNNIQTSNTTTKEQNDTNSNTTPTSEYPPIGRAGTYTGEIQTIDGDDYAWTGRIWRPVRPDNRGNNNTGSGGGNSGGSGGSGGGNNPGRRGML